MNPPRSPAAWALLAFAAVGWFFALRPVVSVLDAGVAMTDCYVEGDYLRESLARSLALTDHLWVGRSEADVVAAVEALGWSEEAFWKEASDRPRSLVVHPIAIEFEDGTVTGVRYP